jgi:hypothetical protein
MSILVARGMSLRGGVVLVIGEHLAHREKIVLVGFPRVRLGRFEDRDLGQANASGNLLIKIIIPFDLRRVW